MDLVVKAGVIFCALSYLGLAGLALTTRRRAPHIKWLIAASLVTAAWATAQWPFALSGIAFASQLALLVEVVKTLTWVGFLSILTGLSRDGVDRWLKGLLAIGIALPVSSVVIGIAAELIPVIRLDTDMMIFSAGIGIMLLEVTGLLILENLFRNASQDQRWGTLYLCVGLAAFFVYDFFFYAESLLFKRLDVELAGARTFVTALAVPLIAISLARVRFWKVDVHVSRQMVFHTAVLMGAGGYLIVMSLVAWGLRQFGGEAGAVFQITFLVLAVILMIVVFSSGSVRSRLRLFIGQNFYSSKYDYREEWLRFITTLGSGHEETSIAQRVVSAITPIVDSTAAALWITDRSAGELRPAVSWNYGDALLPLDLDSPLVRSFGEPSAASSGVLVYGDRPDRRAAGLVLPDWIERERKTWLVLPLVYRRRLHGLLLLGEPRAPREFDTEDRNLLAIVTSQAASYLAEDRAASALAQSRKIEEFNRRFTFVAHDLKNVVNQLSILVKNAERHGDNPAFQKDMVATVANSVERMNGLMEDLKTRAEEPTAASALETLKIPTFDFVMFLKDFTAIWRDQGARVLLDCRMQSLQITTNRDMLTSVLNHMVQNSVDASGPEADIIVSLCQIDGEILLEVTDKGPGMAADFLESVFFKPFGTTKEGGYGIGGFQIHQHVKDLGARLNVITAPGAGTRMQVFLPLSPSAGTISADEQK